MKISSTWEQAGVSKESALRGIPASRISKFAGAGTCTFGARPRSLFIRSPISSLARKFFSRQDVDQRVGSLRVFESPGKGVDMIRFLFVSVAFVTLILFPIVAEADGHLDLNTDLRLRWEYSSPWDPGEPGDTVTMMRTHVGMNTDFTDNIHFMLGVLDSRSLSGQDDPEIGDGVPGVHQVHVQVADLSRLHESLGFLAGWSLGLGRSELPNYGNGRIIHSAEWSNVGPATADGYHLASQFLDGALDLNIHYLTLAKDPTGAAGSGDHFYGAHLDVDSLPFIEASFYYWKYRADLANAAAAAANGLADPGSSDEDTYGYLFTLRDGIIPRVGVTFEYALQDGNRYDALDDGAIQKLDSLYFAFEGTYDMPQMAGFWDMDWRAGHIMATGTAAGATREEAFRSVFGTPHGTHGIADVVDNSNIRDTYFGFSTVLYEADVALSFHNLRADQGEDWGNEWDLVVSHPLGDLLDLEVGLANFTSTSSLRESTDFIYAQTYWQF